MRPKKTVLCVGPCEFRLSRQAFVLETHGYRVLRATTAAGALKVIAEREVRPDVLVTEYELDDFSGNRLAEDAKLMSPDLPVLVISHMMVTFDNATSANRFLPKMHCDAATVLDSIRILASRRPGPKKTLTTPIYKPEAEETAVA
jgi:DNA-binding NtrC family response regulator